MHEIPRPGAAPRRRSRAARWLTRIALGVGGVLLLSLALAYGVLRASLPQVTGRLALAGLEHPVRVIRDPHGIPTIEAETAHDLAMALGFVHAQDRLFQMDLQRRLGAGRLAEIVGPAAFGTDRQMRRFGLYRHAEAGVGAASPDFRGVIEAYAAGVNGFLHSGAVLPVEFSLMGYRPEDWRPADSLVIGKLLALELTGNYGTELVRARLAPILSAGEMAELFPDYPKDAPVTLGRLAALTRDLPLDAMLADLPFGAEPQRASNDWVVDGPHSTTGRPLLANDPHLDYAAPLVWYLARLEAPGLAVAGATIAGAPAVILGHNDAIAWGYTTTNADVEDLFVEEPDPRDPARYLTPEGSAPFETRRGADRHQGRGARAAGDPLDPARPGDLGRVRGSPAARRPVRSWRSRRAFSSMTTARSRHNGGRPRRTTGRAGATPCGPFTAPPLNMVYADRDGHIGFMVPGRIPIRRSGDGRAPVPGRTGENDWTGFIPFDALPQVLDPPAGHLASANNKIVPDDYPYVITRDWDQPFRIERIETGLAATPRQSIETTKALQADIVSLAAANLLPLMLEAEPGDAGFGRCPRAAAALGPAHGGRPARAADLLRLGGGAEPAPVRSPARRALRQGLDGAGAGDGRGAAAEPALVRAGRLSGGAQGVAGRGPRRPQGPLWPRPRGLALGRSHQAIFDHPVFSRIACCATSSTGTCRPTAPTTRSEAGGFRAGLAPGSFADVHARACGPSTISPTLTVRGRDGARPVGHLLSPHYDDLQPLWRRFDRRATASRTGRGGS